MTSNNCWIYIIAVMVFVVSGLAITTDLHNQREQKMNESMRCVEKLAQENYKSVPYPTDFEIQNYYNDERKACVQQNYRYNTLWDAGGQGWTMFPNRNCDILIYNNNHGNMTLEKYYNVTKTEEKYPLKTREFMREMNHNKYMMESMRCWD